MSELFQQLLSWVSAHPLWAGFILFLVSMAESLAIVGLVVPGVLIMFGIGALIAAGAIDFGVAVAWAVAGAVAGDGISFWLGRHYRDRLTRLWPFSRYPRSLQQGMAFFEKYGGKSVAFGRFFGPVRAVIPLVAGMLGMTPGRFLVANVLSALAWAPAYLLPGMVFGASLQLASEVALRLVVLGLVLVLALWFAAWISGRLFRLLQPHATQWVQAFMGWARLHPAFTEIASALGNPAHREARGLAELATLLLITSLGLVLLATALFEGGFLLPDRVVRDGLQALQTPFGDRLFDALAGLGGLDASLLLGVTVGGFLVLRGHPRASLHWLAALSLGYPLALAAAPLPALTAIGIPVLLATLGFGFLAVLVAGGLPQRWRRLPYVFAAALVTLVGLGVLYEGGSPLSGVLLGMTLGLAWVTFLGIAWRRRGRRQPRWWELSLLALLYLALTPVWTPPTEALPPGASQQWSLQEWHTQGWQTLPERRDDLRGQHNHPLNLQYVGSLDGLTKALQTEGWRPAPAFAWHELLLNLSTRTPLAELPVLPHVNRGRHEALVLVRMRNEEQRELLRLWPTKTEVGEPARPLWIGNLAVQEKKELGGLLALAETRDAFDEMREKFVEELQSSTGPLQITRTDGPLLLSLTP